MSGLPARFWRLYASSATSNLADGIGRTVLPLLAAGLTRDPVLVAGLTSFAFLPWLLFALPGGALVDRRDRRSAMAAANLVRGAALAVLAVLVAVHAGSVPVLYAVAFLAGSAETVYDSATRALLPQVVERGLLDRANSLLTVEETIGQQFAGSPLGSALFGIAAALPLGLVAGGFAAAAALVLTLPGSYRPVREATPTSLRRDVADGVRWLLRHPFLRGLTLISTLTCFASSAITGVLVLYVLDVLRLPPWGYGVVLLAAGAGGLAGGLATPGLVRLAGRARVLTVGSLVAALAYAAMGLTRSGVVAAILMATAEAGVLTWNVTTMSLRQALIPRELFGRVQGAYRTAVWGSIPLGALVGGLLAAVLGVPAVFLLSGAALSVLAVVLGLFLRRHPAELADGASAEAAPAPA